MNFQRIVSFEFFNEYEKLIEFVLNHCCMVGCTRTNGQQQQLIITFNGNNNIVAVISAEYHAYACEH